MHVFHVIAKLVVVAAVGLLLDACGSVRYYAHVAHGQAELLLQRRPITTVLADPATPPALAARPALALRARHFASRQLDLPDNRSYTGYVALHRPYVAWNVFVTAPFSVDARPQCFPIAGCVAYRGYFRQSLADGEAERWRARGDDVWIGPVPAYSTLGWFADPILSSMLRWDDAELAGTIFHELAHQLIYLRGDTAFNESFATFVQAEGVRQWRQSLGLLLSDDHVQAMDAGFTALVLDLRKRLQAQYASSAEVEVLAAAKQREIAAFRSRYSVWRATKWPNDHRYDRWVATPINNARLLPFGLYDRWTEAFAALFRQAGGDWSRFYIGVRDLAHDPATQRVRQLDALQRSAAPAASVGAATDRTMDTATP